MSDLGHAEYRALRDTIRERGTVRMWTTLGGFAAWGALAIAFLAADIEGTVALVPLVVLAATYEILSLFVDARLRNAYGDEYGLVVETAPGAGTKVIVRVPKFAPGVRP